MAAKTIRNLYLIYLVTHILKSEEITDFNNVQTFNALPGSILKQEISGYTLQVLKKTKVIALTINGITAKASLPIYIYIPNNNLPGLELMKNAETNLEALTRKSDWDKEEIDKIINDLKQSIVLLSTFKNKREN